MTASPKISVLMPAYNAEKYIEAAIQSILGQSFTDFELLIIDDASTDRTPEIIHSITDSRIRYIRNTINSKIVATLNNGLNHASGIYVARMDADDISLPDRLLFQSKFLDEHPEVAAIDNLQLFMDEAGNLTGDSNAKITGTKAIKQTLPWYNCLGHPSVMVRRDVLLAYKYRNIVYEDYDLWLRMTNDHYLIEKNLTPQLWYRMHDNSLTGIAKTQKNHFRNLANTKWFYWKNLDFYQKFNPFNLKVLIALLKDYATWIFKLVKG